MTVTIESNAIIEAAARALEISWNNRGRTASAFPIYLQTREALQAILAAVTPLIEANALEREAYTIRERITAAVTPLIRAAALEEAAVVAEDVDRDVGQNSDAWSVGYFAQHIRGTAAAIRALKEQP